MKARADAADVMAGKATARGGVSVGQLLREAGTEEGAVEVLEGELGCGMLLLGWN